MLSPQDERSDKLTSVAKKKVKEKRAEKTSNKKKALFYIYQDFFLAA